MSGLQPDGLGENKTFGSVKADGLRSKEQPVFDVTAWGAVGDGVTDDRQAILDAINAASAVRGEVFFPATSEYYLVDGELFFDAHDGITLSGAGYGSHIRQASGNDANLITSEGNDDVTIKDLRVSHAGLEGIDVNNCENALVSRVWAHDNGQTDGAGDGLDFDFATDSKAEFVLTWDNQGGGIHTSEGSERVEVESCISVRDRQSDQTTFASIDMRNAENCTIKNCIVIDAGQDAYRVAGSGSFDSANAKVIDCYAFNPSWSGIELNGGTLEPTVENLTVVNAGEEGIHDFSIRPTFRGCTVKNSTDEDLLIEEFGTGPAKVYGGVFDGTAADQNIRVERAGTLLDGVTARNGAEEGIRAVEPTRMVNVTVENPTQTDGFTGAITVNAESVLDNPRVVDADTAIHIGGSTPDVRINNPTTENITSDVIDDGGTRTKWNGVIGGGPLGGVDISTVTGAETGDLARTTGASAAGADVIAVFDGSDWVYPTRGGAVTPA